MLFKRIPNASAGSTEKGLHLGWDIPLNLGQLSIPV